LRIAYDNLLDAAFTITPLTEETLYEATKVQDQRLTTQWRTTAATDQTIIFSATSDTIVGGNIGLVTGSSATNLVTDPENLTSANWITTNSVITTVESILGYPAYKVTSVAGGSAGIVNSANGISVASQQTVVFIARKDSTDTAKCQIFNASSVSEIMIMDIAFAAKTVTYSTGAASNVAPEWIDDDTVRIFAKPASASVGNAINIQLFADKDNGAGESAIYSAPFVIDNTFPVPFVETSRAAVDTNYAQRLPPSGKFIIDCEFKPFFPFDVGANRGIGGWNVNGNTFLQMLYAQSSDKILLNWMDGTATRTLSSNAFVASTLNKYIRLTASLDLSVVAAASDLYVDNVLVASAFSAIKDVLTSSTFTTLELGLIGGGSYFDGIFRRFHVYGGNFASAESITTEATMDSALDKRQLVFAQDFQNQFNLDTVAIMGHNIGEGAAIKVELNDWDEWNYTDGSGSSIIQEVLTWDDETILKMFTKVKRQYARFTISDPNNDDGILKIGRIWGGPFLDISPSSLDDFRVIKKRSDRNIYGINRQKWSDVGVGWRQFELTFPRTEATMLNSIQTMYDEVGNHSSFLYMNFDLLRSWPIIEPLYCSIVGDITFGHRGRQKYTYGITIEEDK